jgi:hypothetical protein
MVGTCGLTSAACYFDEKAFMDLTLANVQGTSHGPTITMPYSESRLCAPTLTIG